MRIYGFLSLIFFLLLLGGFTLIFLGRFPAGIRLIGSDCVMGAIIYVTYWLRRD
jgi:hypothetical protein